MKAQQYPRQLNRQTEMTSAVTETAIPHFPKVRRILCAKGEGKGRRKEGLLANKAILLITGPS